MQKINEKRSLVVFPQFIKRFAPALVPIIPFLWLLFFFATPFLIVFKISLSSKVYTSPPYTPQFEWGHIAEFLSDLSTDNYLYLLGVPLSSFVPVIIIIFLTLWIGLPLAFFTATRAFRGKLFIGTVLVFPYLIIFLSYLLSKVGVTYLYDWIHLYCLWQPEKPENPIPLIWDWLGQIYLLLGPIVFCITGIIGKLEKRHYTFNGAFSLKHSWNTYWRKGKGALLLALLISITGSIWIMMWREFDGDPLYWIALLSSLRIATISTILLLIVGFPIAYSMAQAPSSWRPVLLAFVMLPFWIVFLIRIYSWRLVLDATERFLTNIMENVGGLLLSWTGYRVDFLFSQVTLLNTEFAVFVGIVYGYLPFMILPLYATLEKMDMRLVEAATDLGSPPWRTFWTITVPLAKPGIFAGSLLCFIPSVGEYVIPELLGGSDTLMIGKILSDEFFKNLDWPLASSVAVVLLIILVIPIMMFQRLERIDLEEEEA